MFNIPVTNLTPERIFYPVITKTNNSIIISPDLGGVPRARKYCSLLGMDLSIIDKIRDMNNNCLMFEIMGNVNNKHCIIIDDIVNKATTLCMASELLLKKGAKSVQAIVTHALLSKDTIQTIEQSNINKIYITDSIHNEKLSNKFTVLPISKLFGLTIKNHINYFT